MFLFLSLFVCSLVFWVFVCLFPLYYLFLIGFVFIICLGFGLFVLLCMCVCVCVLLLLLVFVSPTSLRFCLFSFFSFFSAHAAWLLGFCFPSQELDLGLWVGNTKSRTLDYQKIPRFSEY